MFCRICNAAVIGKGLSVSEQLVGMLRAASGGHISFATIADAARCVPTMLCSVCTRPYSFAMMSAGFCCIDLRMWYPTTTRMMRALAMKDTAAGR